MNEKKLESCLDQLLVRLINEAGNADPMYLNDYIEVIHDVVKDIIDVKTKEKHDAQKQQRAFAKEISNQIKKNNRNLVKAFNSDSGLRI